MADFLSAFSFRRPSNLSRGEYIGMPCTVVGRSGDGALALNGSPALEALSKIVHGVPHFGQAPASANSYLHFTHSCNVSPNAKPKAQRKSPLTRRRVGGILGGRVVAGPRKGVAITSRTSRHFRYPIGIDDSDRTKRFQETISTTGWC